MTARLTGKTGIITGGASGLGKAMAKRLVDDGANVVITDVQLELGGATAEELGVTFIAHDVTDERQWESVAAKVERQFGTLNIVVNNAGVAEPADAGTPENTKLADWRRVFAVNVEGVFLGCRTAIGALRRAGGGSIINVSSVAALRAYPDATAYGASKAAVRQLTMSVAKHCAAGGLNIRCNSVHPGYVRTPLWERGAQETAQLRNTSVAQIVAETIASVPLGDFTHPDDIAAAVSFLCSDDSRHITGTALVVDGGEIGCS
jgi:NAD(P)-dependent dehydrogenase (short-subunit alcohol dehydrogenase family)